MKVHQVADRGDRNLVDIHPGGRQRAATHPVSPFAAAGDAAKEQLGLSRTVGLETHAGQQLGVVVEAVDLVLVEDFAAQGLQADGHVLEPLLVLLRGHHDFRQTLAPGRVVRRIGSRHRRQQHRKQRRGS